MMLTPAGVTTALMAFSSSVALCAIVVPTVQVERPDRPYHTPTITSWV